LLNKLKFSKFFNIFSIKNEDEIVEEEINLLKQNVDGYTYDNVCVICYSYCNNRLQCCKAILCIACNTKIEKCPICRTFFDHNGIIDLNDDDSTDSLDYQEITRQLDINNAESIDDTLTIDSLN
jgi:hypothetical protein